MSTIKCELCHQRYISKTAYTRHINNGKCKTWVQKMEEKKQIAEAQAKAQANRSNIKDSRFAVVTVTVVTVVDKVTGKIVDKSETTSSEYT